MKRFVTIVPHIDNIELRKDTGQVPYHFYKELGYDATLVSYFYSLTEREKGPVISPPQDKNQIIQHYPYLDTEVKGLKLKFLPYNGRGKFYERSIFNFLKEEAKNIDILNLFHFSSENIFYSLLYKLKNPKGKIYIKLDIDVLYYKSRKSFFNTNGKLGIIKNKIYSQLLLPLFFKKISLFSAESIPGLNYFRSRFPLSKNKIILIPNGLDLSRVNTLISQKRSFEEKENMLVVVGKVGDDNKNHTFLLEALKKVTIKDWKFYFIGKIEHDFNRQIEAFYTENPELKQHVTFTGLISDPSTLYDYYNKAKVFCMPSKGEGFPLSAVEAAVFGNVLLLSDKIVSYDTLTDNGAGGEKFEIEDLKSLTELVQRCIDSPSYLLEKHNRIVKYARNTFNWSEIVRRLDKELSRNG